MAETRSRWTLGSYQVEVEKTKYKEEDIVFLEECLKKEPRTYNSLQLAQKLFSDRQIQLSPDRLRRVLKKRGSFGNEQEKAIKGNKIQKSKK